MPRRREVIKNVRKAAKAIGMEFVVRREGASHTVFDLDGVMIPIRRHRDFTDRHAEQIYRECEAKLGRGWWR